MLGRARGCPWCQLSLYLILCSHLKSLFVHLKLFLRIMSTGIGSESKRTRRRRGSQGNRKRACGDESTTAEKDLGSDEANGEASGLKKRKALKKVTEDVMSPEQRTIPDTPLLHNLGKHPSIYARLGRVKR